MDNVRRRNTSVPLEPAENAAPMGTGKKQPPLSAAVSPVSRSRFSRYCCRCCGWRCCSVLLFVITVVFFVALNIGYKLYTGPKQKEDLQEDARNYGRWWWRTALDGRYAATSCSYADLRFSSWGTAVDAEETCACDLRRCPPASQPRSSVMTAAAINDTRRESVAISGYVMGQPTLASLSSTCAAAQIPLLTDASADPLRVFEPPEGTAAPYLFVNVRTPMCVQAGRVYAVLRPSTSVVTPIYRLGARELYFDNLTDTVLRNATKYHPITTVPAAGLLFTILAQEANFFTFMQDGLRGWGALMERGFGAGFDSAADRDAWRAVPRQALFLSDPSMDDPARTLHSSQVAREIANAFTVPQSSPYFAVAPISRTRAAETVRAPMYCFCGGFVIPSLSLIDDEGRVTADGYRHVRRTVNAYFHGAPLGGRTEAEAEQVRVRSPLYDVAAVRAAWPPRIGTTAVRRPRLLWIGRKRPRIVSEADMIELAREAGFEVLVDNTLATEASAETQFYLSRYADVVVGFHGVALGNALWMDAEAKPNCRALLEFLPYALASQVTEVYGAPMGLAGVHYWPVEPVEAEFTSSAYASAAAQEAAKLQLMGQDSDVKLVRHHPAFVQHRAVYNMSGVRATFAELYQQLKNCL